MKIYYTFEHSNSLTVSPMADGLQPSCVLYAHVLGLLWDWSPSPCSTPRIPAPWCLEDRQLHSAQLWSLSTSLLLLRSSSWWCRWLPPHTLWTIFWISWIRTCKQYRSQEQQGGARFFSSGLQWAEPANLILIWAKVTDLLHCKQGQHWTRKRIQ